MSSATSRLCSFNRHCRKCLGRVRAHGSGLLLEPLHGTQRLHSSRSPSSSTRQGYLKPPQARKFTQAGPFRVGCDFVCLCSFGRLVL